MANFTTMTELLLDLFRKRDVDIVCSALFLALDLVASIGIIFIIAVISTDYSLCLLMYFFLKHLLLGSLLHFCDGAKVHLQLIHAQCLHFPVGVNTAGFCIHDL